MPRGEHSKDDRGAERMPTAEEIAAEAREIRLSWCNPELREKLNLPPSKLPVGGWEDGE